MLWRVYFAIYIIGTLLAGIQDYPNYIAGNYWSWLFLLDSVAKIAALYAFIFKAKFFTKYDWRIIFWPILFLFLYLLYSSIFPSQYNLTLYETLRQSLGSDQSIQSALLIGSLFEVPAIIVLYKLSGGKLSLEKPHK